MKFSTLDNDNSLGLGLLYKIGVLLEAEYIQHDTLHFCISVEYKAPLNQ